jgi:uncharacterized protein with beta-barrel porin domain
MAFFRNRSFLEAAMCGLSRPSQIEDGWAGRRIIRAVAVALVTMLAGFAFSPAYAQVGPTSSPSPTPTPIPTPTPSPTPVPTPTQINSEISASGQVLFLGSNFLERLGNQATNGANHGLQANPGGGGASETIEAPRYRSWGEVYDLSITTDAQGDFVGDKRRTLGGVMGVGARIAPGVNVGFSVDQSHTQVDVPLALQSATIDLTQLGFTASVDKGPWTWALALVHGFGNIGSSRDTGLGIATAGYGTRVDGALTELSYYFDLPQQSRIVPKLDLEYVRGTTGTMQEVGGLNPVSATGTTQERAFVMLGAEIGHYWILDRKVLDLSAYGKFVDNFSQSFGSAVVSLGPQAITVQGIGEGQYGADTGASASLSLTNTVRVYLNYDGKFRSQLTSHQGTLGLELRW